MTRPPCCAVLRRSIGILAAACLVVAACGGDDDGEDSGREAGDEQVAADVGPVLARPPMSVSSTWHWQLQGALDTSVDADVYDIDLFESTPEVIDGLRRDGRLVICYFSAGSYEPWRPDAAGYDDADLGEALAGFEDERWLDIGSDTVRGVIEGRLDRAVAIGCDGVEPDNVDGDTNDTGFDLTGDDMLDFNRFIAAAAHERDLLVGLKNADRHVPDLVDDFDFAVNEQCHEFDECDAFVPFIDQGKPVFNAEYAAGVRRRSVAGVCRRACEGFPHPGAPARPRRFVPDQL